MKQFILFFITSLCSIFCIASPFTFKRLGNKEGLSNNNIQGIAQDHKGYVWLATENGLNRFDGYHFSVYNRSNSDLPGNIFGKLYYDSLSNILWIGGENLCTLDPSTYRVTLFNKNEKGISDFINNFNQAADGKGIWISTAHKGVVFYDKSKHIFRKLYDEGYEIPHTSVLCTYDDGYGNLYIGYGQEGLYIVNLKNKTVESYKHVKDDTQSLPGNSVYKIYCDHKGNIWIGTNQGLALFNPLTKSFISFHADRKSPNTLISDHIYDIQEIDNKLWIATDIGGISILDLKNFNSEKQNVSFHNITANNTEYGLSSKNIRLLMEDSFGNIWIVNQGYGIDFISHLKPIFNKMPQSQLTNSNDLKSSWGIICDNKGDLWIGGENEVRLFRNNIFIKKYDLTPYLNRTYAQILSIVCCENNNLLLGTFDDGLLKLYCESGRVERIAMDKPYIDIDALAKDTNGTIWIGSENGIYSYKDEKLQIEKKINDALESKFVQSIVLDKLHRLWIGTGAGICIFDTNKRHIATIKRKNNESKNITTLFLDSDGEIWAGTRDGLMHFKDITQPQNYTIYGETQNLDDTYIKAISESDLGELWFSTNNALYCLRNKKQPSFIKYTYRDGIVEGSFAKGGTCKNKDGILYFNSSEGTCFFNPQDLLFEGEMPPVQIIKCTPLNNKENSFSVSFSTPDYALHPYVEYAYQINGQNNEWVNVGTSNEVIFHNITPGHYVFKIKARIKNHSWQNSSIAVLPIHIPPPFYLSWYAKLFYFLLIILGTYISMHIYKKRFQMRTLLQMEQKKRQAEQELNAEKLRFFTNITHELRTPLTLIIGPLQDLISDKAFPETYKQVVHTIYSSANRLLQLVNEILEFRKIETENRQLIVKKENLCACITEIGLQYQELNRNKNVKIILNIPHAPILIYFDAEVVTTILSNLLSNAIKYTPYGSIILSVTETIKEKTAYVDICVQDTGYGIESQALPHLFKRYYQVHNQYQTAGTGIGLALVKSLTNLHQAFIFVESVVGEGSKFTLRLRSDETYPNAIHPKKNIEKNIELEIKEIKKENKSQLTILLVEDNIDIRNYIHSLLCTHYQVIDAVNGQDGWEKIKKHMPNLIISDIMMPIMNGIELCKKIKEDICTCHIPIILLTSKSALKDKEEGYDSGADSYLTKPFSSNLLLSRIVNILETRRQLTALVLQRAKELIKTQVPTQSTEKNITTFSEGFQSIKLNKMDELFISKLTKIIQDNLTNERLDNNYLSNRMNMSESTLYRKVKSLTGITCIELIRKLRLQHALHLITEEGYNVSEAAYNSGFSDVNYFRNCFKEEFGNPPSYYKK